MPHPLNPPGLKPLIKAHYEEGEEVIIFPTDREESFLLGTIRKVREWHGETPTYTVRVGTHDMICFESEIKRAA